MIRTTDPPICYSNGRRSVIMMGHHLAHKIVIMREWIDILASFTDTLPYHLNRVSIKMSEMFSAQLHAFDISLFMYRVLMALYERQDQRLGELADINSIEISTMSRLIGTMSRRGLVTRDRSRDNGRTVTINLTPKGRALIQDIIPIAKAYEDVVTSRFNAAEIAQIKGHLSAIHASLVQLEAQGALLAGAHCVQDNKNKAATQQIERSPIAASAPHHVERASALSDAGE